MKQRRLARRQPAKRWVCSKWNTYFKLKQLFEITCVVIYIDTNIYFCSALFHVGLPSLTKKRASEIV